jgi:YhcH/YjgK/YiaL family protein
MASKIVFFIDPGKMRIFAMTNRCILLRALNGSVLTVKNMIIDSLTGLERYFPLNRHFEKVFKFLRSRPLHALTEGRHVIDGDNACLTVSVCDGKEAGDARLEVHDSYIDIQMPLEGVETIGWRDRSHCEQLAGRYDEAHDVAFFDDPPAAFFTLDPLTLAILFPHDAHAPLIGNGKIKKIVVKVKIR